ncbi:MAG: uroporphyrinogen decarboxylase family protein [Planctomycetota bacterium]|jgi:uroporphyrinogen decarboxylase
MTSRERVLSTLNRTGYDRIPIKHEGTPEVNQMLMEHFGLSNTEQLLRVVGDDFRYVEADYIGPELHTFEDGSVEGYWGERYNYIEYEDGKYLESVYQPYAGVETLDDLDRSHFPKADWFDYSKIKQRCQAIRDEFAVCFGTAGDLDLINSIARARGVEQVLLDLATEDPVYMAIMKARFEFYYHMHERALQAADGLIDIVHVGEDYGQQRGPMISLKTFEKLFASKLKEYFEMVHSYGAKTMMHMCGCVDAFLPRLIELGLDIYDVVQPTTPEMDIAELQRKYGDKLNFCGSVCVQTTLPFGTKQEIENEVKRRLQLFSKGGLFLGPTHAVQVRTPLENILTMYRTAGSLTEKIDDSILIAGDDQDKDKMDQFNRSKLF